MLYFSADIHAGHENILKFCPQRNFKSIEDMDKDFQMQILDTLKKDDIFIHLGDFCFGRGSNLENYRYFLNALYSKRVNGVWIKGNHDHDRIEKFSISQRDWFDIYVTNWYKQNYVCCHYPMISWEGMQKGNIHIHGHVHGDPTVKEYYKSTNKKAIDVSYDSIGKWLISAEEVNDLFKVNTSLS